MRQSSDLFGLQNPSQNQAVLSVLCHGPIIQSTSNSPKLLHEPYIQTFSHFIITDI